MTDDFLGALQGGVEPRAVHGASRGAFLTA